MQSGLKSKQRGATFLGMLTIGSILALGVYAGIRLVPLYLDNMAVVKAMTDISKQLSGGDVSPGAIKKSLQARWAVDYIDSVKVEDIEIKPVATGLEMRAEYDAWAPFVGNIFIVVQFNKAVVVSKTGAGGI